MTLADNDARLFGEQPPATPAPRIGREPLRKGSHALVQREGLAQLREDLAQARAGLEMERKVSAAMQQQQDALVRELADVKEREALKARIDPERVQELADAIRAFRDSSNDDGDSIDERLLSWELELRALLTVAEPDETTRTLQALSDAIAAANTTDVRSPDARRVQVHLTMCIAAHARARKQCEQNAEREALMKGAPHTDRCKADRDGECDWAGCPQLRDGEPKRSGRHCPRDVSEEEA